MCCEVVPSVCRMMKLKGARIVLRSGGNLGSKKDAVSSFFPRYAMFEFPSIESGLPY